MGELADMAVENFTKDRFNLADIFGGGTSAPSTSTPATTPAKAALAPATNVAEKRIAEVKEILSRPADVPVAQPVVAGSITYHPDVIQGGEEWLELRRGILTASEMKLIITTTLKVADNDKTRAHVYEIAAQRITEYVEPHYVSDDMLRGHDDEVEARQIYHDNYAPVKITGFITRTFGGFKIGYSPDGLVGEEGEIEIKSRRQKYQLQTLVEHVSGDTIPDDFMIQIQTGLMVSDRKWCDFITYCGGMEMAVVRVMPNPKIQAAILNAATEFEKKVQAVIRKYHEVKKSEARLLPTERIIQQEITI